MAKAATAKSNDDKKKKKKAAAGTVRIKIKTKKGGKSEDRKRGKHEGFEGLSKLIDHPLVADLLAVGALAAVAAIAENRMDKGQSSSKIVKSVGKAAAAAMGKKLFADIGAIGGAAAAAAKKA